MFSLYFQINIYFVYIKYVDDKLSSTSFDISVFFTVSQLLTQCAFLKPGLLAVPLPPFSHAHSLPHSGQTLRTSLLMTCFLYCCFSDTPDKTPSLISPTVCSFSLLHWDGWMPLCYSPVLTGASVYSRSNLLVGLRTSRQAEFPSVS